MEISSLSGYSRFSPYKYNDNVARLEQQKMYVQKDLQVLLQTAGGDAEKQREIVLLQQRIMRLELQISRIKAERARRQNSANSLAPAASGFSPGSVNKYSNAASSRVPPPSRFDVRI